MKVYFTGIFETYRVENNFFLINKKLDTIIPIDGQLYRCFTELKEDQRIDVSEIGRYVLDLLVFNRVLRVEV